MFFKEPTVGEVSALFSDYRNITFHRKGGFKAVYFAEKDSQKEALKFVHIPDPSAGDPQEREEIITENVKRVKRELQILGECKSPFVVKLGSLDPSERVIGNERFIAYSEEYLDGSDLHSLIRSQHHPIENELRDLGRCLVRAVKEFWFNLKIVHRDIKPLNVIKISDPERPFVLLDFGIAYAIRDTALTVNPANIPGSLLYLAPEMLHPNFREILDYRSDLYTIALTIYEYATGVQPFARQEEATGQTLSRILNDKAKPLRELRPDLSDAFCQIVNQLLRKKPALRPSNLDMIIALMEVRQ